MSDSYKNYQANKTKIQLMTHVVAGYRSREETANVLGVMSEVEVDYIEIQIPFSDPIGDGPTISQANQGALDAGMTVSDAFSFFEEMATRTKVPLLVMTYANIAFRMGFERFITRAKDAGAKGVIIPDLPLEGVENRTELSTDQHSLERSRTITPPAPDPAKEFFHAAELHRIPVVPVISPNTSQARMVELASLINSDNALMVYCTRRTGITGTHSNVNAHLKKYFTLVKKYFNIPIAGGFGISSIEQINKLEEEVDIAVIGSHIINLYKDCSINSQEGFDKVRKFLIEAKNACHRM